MYIYHVDIFIYIYVYKNIFSGLQLAKESKVGGRGKGGFKKGVEWHKIRGGAWRRY